jgi:hypothetical protein
MMLHLAEVYAHTRILLSQIKEGSKLSDNSLAKIEMISPELVACGRRLKELDEVSEED